MVLVHLQRTGSPVFQWDLDLDRGHRFDSGETLMVSPSLAQHLSGVEGWAVPAAPASIPEEG